MPCSLVLCYSSVKRSLHTTASQSLCPNFPTSESQMCLISEMLCRGNRTLLFICVDVVSDFSLNLELSPIKMYLCAERAGKQAEDKEDP